MFFGGLSLFQKKKKKNFKILAIDLSKQQALDAHPKAIQQFDLTGNLDQQKTMFLVNKDGIIRADQDFKYHSILWLTLKYYQNEPKFDCLYCKRKLHKVKYGDYVNFVDYKSIWIHCETLGLNDDYVINLDSFVVKQILKAKSNNL